MSGEIQTSATAERGLRKSLTGTVMSNKMDKTVVVAVPRRVKHPEYKKYVKSRETYKAHDDKNECNVGDTVVIHECRPLSRDKRWRVTSITRRATA